MNNREKYPELFQFFGGSFHQDWNDFFETPEDVIHNYVIETHHTWIEKAILELKTLLKEEHSFEEWARILYDDFGCEYFFDYENDYTPKKFFEKVLNQLEDELPLAMK